MTFNFLPTIDIMIDLYEKPRSFERFQAYLKTLEGGKKGNFSIPISGFNPMAKEHLLDRLTELKSLGAEQIVKEMLNDLNRDSSLKNLNREFQVAINISDDLKGGWTNRYTSDYDSKFKMSGLFNKNFCIPVFWSSEVFTKNMIKERASEYVFRTIYWMSSPKPRILKEHFDQEIFVARHTKGIHDPEKINFDSLEKFYRENQNTDNYHVIFNFFYGDKASASLEFPTYGIAGNFTGFEYAKAIAKMTNR